MNSNVDGSPRKMVLSTIKTSKKNYFKADLDSFDEKVISMFRKLQISMNARSYACNTLTFKFQVKSVRDNNKMAMQLLYFDTILSNTKLNQN